MFNVLVLQLPKYFGGEVQPEDLEVLREKILVVERLIGTDKKFVTGNSLTLADIALGAIIPSFDLAQAGLTPASVTAYLQRVYQACPQLKEINESSTLWNLLLWGLINQLKIV